MNALGHSSKTFLKSRNFGKIKKAITYILTNELKSTLH